MPTFPTSDDLAGGYGDDIGVGETLTEWMGDVGTSLNDLHNDLSDLIDSVDALPESFQFSVNTTSHPEFITQGGGTINLSSGFIAGIYTPCVNAQAFTITMHGQYIFGAGTAGEAGVGIYINMAAVMQLIGGQFEFAMNLPYGPKGQWQGTVSGTHAGGMFFELANENRWDAVLVSDFVGSPIHTGLIEGDDISWNTTWYVTLH